MTLIVDVVVLLVVRSMVSSGIVGCVGGNGGSCNSDNYVVGLVGYDCSSAYHFGGDCGCSSSGSGNRDCDGWWCYW